MFILGGEMDLIKVLDWDVVRHEAMAHRESCTELST